MLKIENRKLFLKLKLIFQILAIFNQKIIKFVIGNNQNFAKKKWNCPQL